MSDDTRSPTDDLAQRLQRDIQQAAERASEVQGTLRKLRVASAADPLVELREGTRIQELAEERDDSLRELGLLHIAWIGRGGEVRLVDGDGSVMPSLSGGDRRGPETTVTVVTRGRRVAKVVDYASMPDASSASWTRGASRSAPPIELDTDLLEEVLRGIGEPMGPLVEVDGVHHELDRLTVATSAMALEQWTDLPKPVQKALVGMVVARARHVQDEIAPGLFPSGRLAKLDRIFSAMTAYSKREQPGFVFGLQRSHVPQRGSWLGDGQRWWEKLAERLPEGAGLAGEDALDLLEDLLDEEEFDEDEVLDQARKVLDSGVPSDDPRLVDIMSPYLDILGRHARFKRLRRAIRDGVGDEHTSEISVSDAPVLVPSSWEYWDQVAGKRAAIVGGDLNDAARKQIQDAFRFAALDWVSSDNARNIQVLGNAVEGGAIEFVLLLLRFVDDSVVETVTPACSQADVPCVEVPKGYGVTQIRLAIEESLDGNGDSNGHQATGA